MIFITETVEDRVTYTTCRIQNRLNMSKMNYYMIQKHGIAVLITGLHLYVP